MKRREIAEEMISMDPVYPHKKGRMSMKDRAARFAPFAALTAHEESVKEKEKDRMEFEEERSWDEEYINFLLRTREE